MSENIKRDTMYESHSQHVKRLWSLIAKAEAEVEMLRGIIEGLKCIEYEPLTCACYGETDVCQVCKAKNQINKEN